MKLTLLGCGTSTGVPRIGNDWGACDPTEPRNRRTRCSALVETGSTRILIDTGPDMREQLNAASVSTIDAVIWTHDHADHTHGIDDLRQLTQNAGLPVLGYARPDTHKSIERRFSYVFHGHRGYPPTVNLHRLPDVLTIGDVEVNCIDQPHGSITSAGLKFTHDGKSIVYSTDFHTLTNEMCEIFANCDVWLIDALRHRPHPSHNALDAALAYVERVRPKLGVLIHMDNSLDYGVLSKILPAGVVAGFDGMTVMP